VNSTYCRQEERLPPAHRYRFAWPLANFFTFGFLLPRGYSRGFFGACFFRAVRFDFFRSSLLNALVFAMYNPSSGWNII
jgi:hypothetical protein